MQQLWCYVLNSKLIAGSDCYIVFFTHINVFAHWAEIYGWPQRWVALNVTTHPKGMILMCSSLQFNL